MVSIRHTFYTLEELQSFVPKLQAAVAEIHAAETSHEKAALARVLRLETMIEMREVCDAAEAIVPADLWTLATYKELLFLDSHTSTGSDSGLGENYEPYE